MLILLLPMLQSQSKGWDKVMMSEQKKQNVERMEKYIQDMDDRIFAQLILLSILIVSLLVVAVIYSPK